MGFCRVLSCASVSSDPIGAAGPGVVGLDARSPSRPFAILLLLMKRSSFSAQGSSLSWLLFAVFSIYKVLLG